MNFSEHIFSSHDHPSFSPGFWQQPAFWIGGGLVLSSLTLRGRPRLALLGTGGTLLYLGGLRNRSICSRGSVLLQCSPEEAYRYWRDFQNLPAFLRNLESVRMLGDGTFRWILRGSGGVRLEATVEITAEQEGSLIEWRSQARSGVEVFGRVQFRPEVADRGTVVKAIMHYLPETVGTGYRVMKIIERKPNFLATQDLRRFKALVEAGEIPTTEGQPHGPRTFATGAKRRLNPDQPAASQRDVTVPISGHRRIA